MNRTGILISFILLMLVFNISAEIIQDELYFEIVGRNRIYHLDILSTIYNQLI